MAENFEVAEDTLEEETSSEDPFAILNEPASSEEAGEGAEEEGQSPSTEENQLKVELEKAQRIARDFQSRYDTAAFELENLKEVKRSLADPQFQEKFLQVYRGDSTPSPSTPSPEEKLWDEAVDGEFDPYNPDHLDRKMLRVEERALRKARAEIDSREAARLQREQQMVQARIELQEQYGYQPEEAEEFIGMITDAQRAQEFYSVSNLAKLYLSSRRGGATGASRVPPSHRSVAAVPGESAGRLSPEDQEVLKILGRLPEV